MPTAFAELIVFPVLPTDMKAAFAAETGWMSHRMAAYEQSRLGAGVTLERVFLAETVFGAIAIACHEGKRDFEQVGAEFTASRSLFDEDFMTRVEVLHGLNETEFRALTSRTSNVLDYTDVKATRDEGTGYAVRLDGNLATRWRESCQQLSGPRRDEFVRFNKAKGYDVHRCAIYDAPEGSLGCVYVEGGRHVAPSERSSDLRTEGVLVEQWQELYGFGVPETALSLGEPVWDWVEGGSNQHVTPLFERFAKLIK